MIFFLRPSQEKCEQQMPLYIAFIDLLKSFDLVNVNKGLFQLLIKIGCPKKFFDNMQVVVIYDAETSNAFHNSKWHKTRMPFSTDCLALSFPCY